MAVRTSASVTVTYCSGLRSAASSEYAGRMRFAAQINPASSPEPMAAALFSVGESSSGSASCVGGRPTGFGLGSSFATAASEADPELLSPTEKRAAVLRNGLELPPHVTLLGGHFGNSGQSMLCNHGTSDDRTWTTTPVFARRV